MYRLEAQPHDRPDSLRRASPAYTGGSTATFGVTGNVIVFFIARGADQTAFASATLMASFSDPLSERHSVRLPQSRAQARTLKSRLALRRLMGSWSAAGGACVLRTRDVSSVASSRLQPVRSYARAQRAWHMTRGLRMAPPNHAFQGSAGQQGWPVPAALRASAPPERER